MSEVTGIFQGALILRSAVLRAMQELRENENLIRDCFASLPQDDLTKERYGEKTVEECVRWFVNANIPVKLGISLTQLTSPCVSIELNNGDEAEATLGDVDYGVVEDDPWRPGHQRELASVQARESYTITTFIQGEPEFLLFLSSLLLFAILRHKEDLLDDRGFTRMTWNRGVFGAMPDQPGREMFFANTLRLNGFVRNCWPVPLKKGQADTPITDTPFAEGVAAAVHNDTGTATSSPVTPTDPTVGANPFDQADWLDRDMLTGKKT